MIETTAMPLVSVGITTYNRPAHLKLALDGVLRQTYVNLEIIVSEDCSPSGETRALLEDYASRDSRIRYIRQPVNIGPPANLRFVLAQASGEYFFWADDDDLRDAQWVETLLRKLTAGNAAVAFSALTSIDPDGNTIRHYGGLPFVGARPWRLARYFLMDGAAGKANLIYGIYRTDFLRGIRHWSQYDRSLLAVDMLFVLDILQYGKAVSDTSVTLYKRAWSEKDQPARSAGDRLRRIARELRQDAACIGVVRHWLDKAVLLLLVPVKLAGILLNRLARRAGKPQQVNP